MSIKVVGVIGLGNMGLGIARSLIRARFVVLGYDIDPRKKALTEDAGITFISNVAELLRTVDVVVLSLPHGRDVEAALTVADGLLTRNDCKVVAIDTSTSDPNTSRRLAARLTESGHALLDAPVSGGPLGARKGTLTMMIGGDEEAFALAQPVLHALATSIFLVGPSGSGNVAKLVNNLLVASHLIMTGEAMRLSAAAGLAPEAILKVINNATGKSVVSETMYPKWILTQSFNSGFSAGLMRKDVRLAMDLASETGVTLPLSAHISQLWENATWLPDGEDFTHMADFRNNAGTYHE